MDHNSSRKIKKISLITPPYHSGVVESAGTWLNVGFVYIAGSLRQAGFDVDYYDAMSLWHNWSDIQKRIEDFKPDVVGVSAGFDGYCEDRLLDLKYTLDGYYQCGRRLGHSFDHVFALLEGGYHLDIKKCVDHFIQGVNNTKVL